MGKGVDFAGNGGMDTKEGPSGTNPGSLGSSKGPVDFAGDGGKDVNHANEPKHGSKPLPSGGIDFAGNV